MKNILLLFIVFYKYFISPLLLTSCRFYPTCSIYAYNVVIKYNIFFALSLIIIRFFKCSCFFKGGFDPIL